MNYAEQLRSPWSGHRTGLIVVVALHLALGWGLVQVLKKRTFDAAPPIIDIAQVLPEQPPPPPLDPVLPQPKAAVPPVIFAPVPNDPPPFTENTTSPTTASNVVPSEQTWTASLPASTVAEGPATPHAVAKPAIANVQACAPGADDYPAAARRAEATGTTRLRFTIDAAGALTRSEIVKSAGMTREHRMLDKVAESKLAGCYFTAGVDENGRAMGGTFEVDYIWKIQ